MQKLINAKIRVLLALTFCSFISSDFIGVSCEFIVNYDPYWNNDEGPKYTQEQLFDEEFKCIRKNMLETNNIQETNAVDLGGSEKDDDIEPTHKNSENDNGYFFSLKTVFYAGLFLGWIARCVFKIITQELYQVYLILKKKLEYWFIHIIKAKLEQIDKILSFFRRKSTRKEKKKNIHKTLKNKCNKVQNAMRTSTWLYLKNMQRLAHRIKNIASNNFGYSQYGRSISLQHRYDNNDQASHADRDCTDLINAYKQKSHFSKQIALVDLQSTSVQADILYRMSSTASGFLHAAVANLDVNLVKAILLHPSVDVDQPESNIEGRTPLYIASSLGSQPLIQVLLKSGANADAINKDGDRPVWIASKLGFVDAVQTLIEWGAITSDTVLYTALVKSMLSNQKNLSLHLLLWGMATERIHNYPLFQPAIIKNLLIEWQERTSFSVKDRCESNTGTREFFARLMPVVQNNLQAEEKKIFFCTST